MYVKEKIVGSAILIPSAPLQHVVHHAHCSDCSQRVFRTTSFARTCSAHPGIGKKYTLSRDTSVTQMAGIY